MNAHIHAIQEMTIARKIIARLWPIENAPSGTSFPVALALAGIKENRVEEVAAVATQAVINPTPVMTCPATKAEVVVATIARQVRNDYSERERNKWPKLVLLMGSISFVWGIFVILADSGSANGTTGYIMLGLGLVCYSISSKVILLAKIWRREFKLANRIPMIPVLTALTCLFLAAFVFELATVNADYFIPARVLVGLGAICFTLFSIVSILESGTSSK